MGSINKILVPVDGSVNGCKAVDEAIAFAEKCNASLDFVYVASNINKDIPSHLVFDRIWEKIPENMKATRHVETGNVPKAILKIADSEKSDMIIMGSRGLGLFKGALIGSVSQKVVEESKVPNMQKEKQPLVEGLLLSCLSVRPMMPHGENDRIFPKGGKKDGM